MTFILDVDLDLETQGHSHLIPHVEIAYKIYIIHMVLNKFNQIIVEMTFTLAVNAELTLNHKTNIGNEFLGSIVYGKVVSYMTYDLLVD